MRSSVWVLLGIFTFSLGCSGVDSIYEEARVDSTRLGIAAASQKVEIHILRTGGAPADWDAVLDGEPVPTDGWDRPLMLVVPGPGSNAYDIVSFGLDGVEGGTGYDQDLKVEFR